jgi:hypothetical protein
MPFVAVLFVVEALVAGPALSQASSGDGSDNETAISSSHKSGGHPSAPASREAQAVWHYNEGVRLHRLGAMEAAMLQWDEALRLKPDYKEARHAVDAAEREIVAEQESQLARAKSAIPEIKRTLKDYLTATTLHELNDLVTDRSANDIAPDLLYSERNTVMNLQQHPPLELNATIFDEFDKFMRQHDLYTILPPRRNCLNDDVPPSPAPDISGRHLLSELTLWAKRIHRSGIDVTFDRSSYTGVLLKKVDSLTYAVRAADWVDIEGIDPDLYEPLEARFEEGKWRIGARPGDNLHLHMAVRDRRFVNADHDAQ